jgi:hypothetical protein
MGSYGGGGGGTTVVQAPPAPNYQESMKSILQAQVEMAPQVFASESKYQPLYNALQAAQQAFQAQQSLNIAKQAYPQVAEIEAAYNQANRLAELGQLQTALPAYQQAFNTLTPGYAQAVANAGQLASSAMAQSLNRPQFSTYLGSVRDPYGAAVQQFQPTQLPIQQPQLPPPAQTQTGSLTELLRLQPAQTTSVSAPSEFKYDQTSADKLSQISADLQSKLPGGAIPTKDPGPPIEPLKLFGGSGFISKLKRKSEIDARNAEIAKYKTDLAAFNAAEAEKQLSAQSILANFDPAAVFANKAAAPAPVAAQQLQAAPVQQPSGPAIQAQVQAPAVLSQIQTQPAAQPPPPAPAPSQGLASNIQNLDQASVNQYVGAMPGMGQYANFLALNSAQELMAGKGLTPEEQRIADQAVRSAYAARGTALGQQAVSAEVLNRADVANRRYQERLQNAAQAAGTIQGIYQPALQQSMQRQQAAIEYGMAQQQAAFNQALQRGQAEQQAYMAGTQAQAGLAGLGASAMSQLQSAQAPVLQAFYKQPILQGQESQAQQMAIAMQQQAGPQFFNPESQTGMGSIYGAYNSQMNLAGAQAQANAAAKAGKSSMMGSIGGALIGGLSRLIPCWVAREVYGMSNPKWVQFRDWMLANASDEFVDAYIEHGPKIAEFISDKPELKNMIRSWMDSKIS